ncbi:MAG: hypothetical protein ABSF34_10845 [Verrucomicrobiota bacterium]
MAVGLLAGNGNVQSVSFGCDFDVYGPQFRQRSRQDESLRRLLA